MWNHYIYLIFFLYSLTNKFFVIISITIMCSSHSTQEYIETQLKLLHVELLRLNIMNYIYIIYDYIKLYLYILKYIPIEN